MMLMCLMHIQWDLYASCIQHASNSVKIMNSFELCRCRFYFWCSSDSPRIHSETIRVSDTLKPPKMLMMYLFSGSLKPF